MISNKSNITIKILTIFGIIPALYLLAISLIFLPTFFSDLLEKPNIADLTIIILILFGICGFAGLILQLISKLENKVKLKIVLLVLSLIGFFGFFTFINGIQSWINIYESIKNFKDNFLELYFVLTPIIITIILIILNFKILKK
ncbi:hypothetical protein [Chishuiella sp.]|uniref:hypothetical protein n=1 Tax=Chishuiella sp. TaxID=1969467 RepID=UPI0028A5B057|nr:hypothetical protein [Chishuiella sp.]